MSKRYKTDKNYCMSSFLTFRYIYDEDKVFKEGLIHKDYQVNKNMKLIPCSSAQDVEDAILNNLSNIDLTKAGLMLSGGIDSAILASYMPKGTKAYTALCNAEGAVDETGRAQSYCSEYGLEHRIVDISWDDYLATMDALSLNDGCPVPPNEPQVYKIAKTMKEDGIETIIFGDSADMVFGGYSELISKDWDYEGWKKRYTYIDPVVALNEGIEMDYVFDQYKTGDGGIDYIQFMNDIFTVTSTGSYTNAFRMANIDYLDPYANLTMKEPLDLSRVRSGDSKYLLRELFRERYPGVEVPEKIAMPRAMDQWMKGWSGPTREEFSGGGGAKVFQGKGNSCCIA